MSRNTDFWSRRKAAVEAEADAAARKAEADATRDEQARLEEKSDEDILEELGLPDPEELQPGQDISAFMQKAVPERLRQRALRKLWRLNPVLANLDGLCDYNDDFTNAATDAPGVATAYKVGKGLLKHLEALEEQQKSSSETAEPSDTPQNLSVIEDADTTPASDAETGPEPENMQEYANAADASTTFVSETSEYADGTPLDTLPEEIPRPRRMRFRIESETG